PAAPPPPPPAASQPTVPPNPALAERLTSMATSLLRSQELSPALWQYCQALIHGAVRLAPDEPRFSRFLVEAAIRTGDVKTAMEALQIYRRARPDDQAAQVQAIEFYLLGIDGAEQKLRYLRQIIDTHTAPATVRSVAAVKAAQLHAERMEDGAAQRMVDRALELNPLNLEAMRVRLSTRPPQSPEERVALYLRMLRANPVQPALGIGIARELAAVGLPKAAKEWFDQSLDLHGRLGVAPPADVGVDYAAITYLGGDPRGAAVVTDRLLQQNPQDLNAWTMRLILARASGDKDELARAIKQANVAVANYLALIRKASGDEAATTQPIDTPAEVALPDPAVEIQRLAGQDRQDLVRQYVPVLANVAWMKIYFEDNPGAAVPWTRALSAVVPANDVALTRLQGWSYLAAGNADEARVKLSAIAEQDALAQLGMIRLAGGPQAKEQSAVAARLLSRNPSGLMGALLFQALSPAAGARVAPSPQAAAVERLVNEFPKEFLRITDANGAPQFYALRLEPVRGGVAVGEPVLVQVIVTNTGPYPLTLGPDGVIRPDLWLDAQLKGAQPHVFPAEAYNRLAGPLVLEKGDSASAVVRLDQRGLAAVLEQFPNAAFQITAMVMTNPTTLGGNIAMGPGGARAGLSRLMERPGANISNEHVRQRLGIAMQNGTPAEKVRAVETLAKYAPMLARVENEQAKQMAGQAADAVRRSGGDPDPTVAAWSTYLFSALTADKEAVRRMLADPVWLNRMLGIVAVDYTGVPRDALRPLAESDPDEVVRKFAAAASIVKIQTGAATQPAATTQPADGGASPAAAAPPAAAAAAPPAPPAPP
ncbi:MAG TPA: hypothetical protein VER17_02250, partial [Tepidisphaeraceae bacterium]|nr:hypothetical protein [Tepidisphaeraceae bacterium]